MNQKWINIVLATLIVVAIGVAFFKGRTIETIREIVTTPLAGITNVDQIAAGAAREKWELLEINSGGDQDVYTNRSGHSEFVSYGQVTSDGTASSSFRVYAFATSTTEVPNSNDYTALVSLSNNRVIDITWATSTTATTTNSLVNLLSDRVVRIPHGSSLILYVQEGDANCQTGATNAGGCEAATSTNRGFSNIDGLFKIIATSTDQSEVRQ